MSNKSPAFNPQRLASMIDHTLLKPEATAAQVSRLCEEALQHHFFGVCVNSLHVPLCVRQLKGSSVTVVAVVGFPLGACDSQTKAFEAGWCVDQGAQEIDMVLSIGSLKEKDDKQVLSDIRMVVKASQGKPLKVILETCLLNDEEKKRACEISLEAGAAFVKTSTGFSTGGATLADVRLMKAVVGGKAQVKASGGIKTVQQAMDFIEAGASRLGTSSGVALVQGLESNSNY